MTFHNEKKQTMLTSIFKTITQGEREVVLAKEIEVLNEAAEIHKSLERESPQKRPIGRPRKSSILLQPQQIKKEKEDDEEHKGGNQHKRKRGPYNKWFTKEFFPPIERAVKRFGRNTDVVNYLKLAFKTPHAPSPYEKLSRASLWNWFDDKGDLRPNFKEASDLGHHVKHQKQNFHVLENHPHVRDQLVSKLEKLRE